MAAQNPCKPLCPKRSSECHATCEEYQEYFYDRAHERQEEQKKRLGRYEHLIRERRRAQI